MSGNFRKKPNRGKNRPYLNDKNSFRNQESSFYYVERKKSDWCDMSIYTIARFLMGNEVQILTKNDRFEGVLRSFDSDTFMLSKVFVFDKESQESIPPLKKLYERKEIFLRDILLLKMLNGNGKFDSVIIDQEISQRKPVPKLTDDKDFVPYFDGENQIHINDEDEDLNSTMKGDQNCWYHPEDMLKVNEERFHVKNTFSEKMEEYTTQIDKNDPFLKEKMEKAERIAQEIENENSMKRGKIMDEDDGQDEELLFSAVPPPHPKSETTNTSQTKLNPNAPEFRPGVKLHSNVKLTEDVPEIADSLESCPPMSLEAMQHQQHQQPQHQQQQQQQQQQLMQFNRLTFPQIAMSPQPLQQYSTQRVISSQQWPIPTIQTQNPGQYVIQQYPSVLPQMLPSRPMAPEATVQPGSTVYYQIAPQFLIQQDHTLTGGIADASHLYQAGIDPGNQINHANPNLHHHHHPQHHQNHQHQLRQSQFLSNIPTILHTTNPMSIHQHQQQQQPPQPNNQQFNAFYQQSPHTQLLAQPNFQQLMMNPPQQQQVPPPIQNGAIQGYITNSRQ